MSKNTAKKIIKQYLAALQKSKFPPFEAYLFGSVTRGTAHEGSDIDVAIVSKKIPSGLKLLKKNMWLRELSLEIDPRIEPLLLDKKEFKHGNESILAREIQRDGIRIE